MAIKKSTTKKKVPTKRKITTRKVTPKNKTKKNTSKTSKSKSNKKAFGGYAINFTGRKETVEEVFGKKPIAPSEMTKKIWAFVKAKSLSNR